LPIDLDQRPGLKLSTKANAEALAALYGEDTIREQASEPPVKGREAIRHKLTLQFAAHRAELGSDRTCIPENIFEDGDWAILMWQDALGFRGSRQASATNMPLFSFVRPRTPCRILVKRKINKGLIQIIAFSSNKRHHVFCE
jgi:ketosteroid isomerase-like protein